MSSCRLCPVVAASGSAKEINKIECSFNAYLYLQVVESTKYPYGHGRSWLWQRGNIQDIFLLGNEDLGCEIEGTSMFIFAASSLIYWIFIEAFGSAVPEFH